MQHKSLVVSSRIVKHLGSELITAPEVAFVELIKNSLDAEVGLPDRNRISVSYYSDINKIKSECLLNKRNDAAFDILPEEYKKSNLFLIEDVGHGMTEEELEIGFLSIGSSLKADQRTDEGVILGEKGIGRLAAQRLGRVLLVETASTSENEANVLLIDWNSITSADSLQAVEVPYCKIPKKDAAYTRLWIFDVNELDMVKNYGWTVLFPETAIELNTDLDNAVSFLLSPFGKKKVADIRFFYDGNEIHYGFDKKYLDYAEAVNSFELVEDDKGRIIMKIGMEIKPWYVKRIHRNSMKPASEFAYYQRANAEYIDFLEKYKERFDKTFYRTISGDELIECLMSIEKDRLNIPETTKREEVVGAIEQNLRSHFEDLKRILPISGCIYSYKKDTVSCRSVFEFKKEKGNEREGIKGIQRFLNDFNGIKLYRGNYRIGFLGNKDSDWLKLLQYRTVGRQFYRFNSGSSLGQVVVNDNKQEFIREISSRLDINRDDRSNVFLSLMELIFNIYFYKENETADNLVKNWLTEEGWMQGNIKKKIEAEKRVTLELQKENQKLVKKLEATRDILQKLEKDDRGIRQFSEDSYTVAMETLDMTTSHVKKTAEYIRDSERELAEASEGLSKIEKEAFNNFKLMANGIITEAITHELHSLVKTSDAPDNEEKINELSSFIWSKSHDIYNTFFVPIKDDYRRVITAMEDVANLYKFLEGTFIKNNAAEEYESISVRQQVENIKERIRDNIVSDDILIDNRADDIKWYLPKGVLLHVLYNLMTNSSYWIEQRRRMSEYDPTYKSNKKDSIVIESIGYYTIRVYDTGTGVLPYMEETLFQALRSGKGAEGRGMGLYIVDQLLQSFEGKIELLPDRNAYNNRYIFEITVPEQCVQGVL